MSSSRDGRTVKRGRVISDEEWQTFLDELTRTGRKAHSAKTAGFTYSAMAGRVASHDHYAEDVDDALRMHKENVEAEIHRRGVEGVDEPVFFQGKQVAEVKKYSDQLLMFYAKKLMPEYREKFADVSVGSGGVLVVGEQADNMKDWLKDNRERKEDAPKK